MHHRRRLTNEGSRGVHNRPPKQATDPNVNLLTHVLSGFAVKGVWHRHCRAEPSAFQRRAPSVRTAMEPAHTGFLLGTVLPLPLRNGSPLAASDMESPFPAIAMAQDSPGAIFRLSTCQIPERTAVASLFFHLVGDCMSALGQKQTYSIYFGLLA